MSQLTVEDLDVLTQRTRSLRSAVDRRRGYAEALARQNSALRENISELQEQILVLEKATALLSSIGERRQLSAQKQIEALVTRGLQVIFGESMSFHLIQSKRGGLPVVDFAIRTTNPDGSILETDVWGATGGGMSAVIGFILQVVELLLGQEDAPIMCLDEPFAGLSDGYADKLVEFLKELIDKTPIQFVLVAHTHVHELAEVADRRYRLHKSDGSTKFKQF